MSRLLGVGFALVWIITVALPTRAANLLLNPDFKITLNDWQETYGKIWDSFDAGGSASSGSARFPVLNANTDILIWQCVSAAPGQDFLVGATMWAQPGATGSGQTKLAAVFYPTTDCSGTGSYHAAVGSSSSTWERIENTYVTPSGTQSARISLTCSSDAVATDFVCYADDAYLPEPSEALLSLVALGSLAGLARLRRIRVN